MAEEEAPSKRRTVAVGGGTLASLLKSIDTTSLIAPIAASFAQVDVNKLIGPKIAASFAQVDVNKLIGPKIAASFA